jgi:TatD DNase family protein
VLRAVLRIAVETGLIVSVHSTGRSGRVLDIIEETGAAMVLLHWWSGTLVETSRAISLGCHFSVNVAMRADLLAALPHDRVLTETDYPSTTGRDPSVARPGAVGSIEHLLADAWGIDTTALRKLEWATVRRLDQAAGRLAAATASVP